MKLLALVLLHRQGAEAALAGEQEQAATYVPDREVSVGIYRVPMLEVLKAVIFSNGTAHGGASPSGNGGPMGTTEAEPWAQCAVVSQ